MGISLERSGRSPPGTSNPAASSSSSPPARTGACRARNCTRISPGTLGTTWTGTGFTPGAGWSGGATGVGFGLQVPGLTIRDAKSSTALNNLANMDALFAGTNRVSQTIVVRQTMNFLDDGGEGRFPNGNLVFPNGGGDDFATMAMGTIIIPTAGNWTFGLNSDDGGRIRIDGVKQSLQFVPTLSIVLDQAGLTDANTGIYTHAGNRGLAWEREASIEMMFPPGYSDPDGNTGGFQSPCGLRIRGGYSLILINPSASPDLNSPASWRHSSTIGGNPSASDALDYAAWKTSHAVIGDDSDDDRDGIGAFLEYVCDGDPNISSIGNLPVATILPVPVGGVLDNYLVLEVRKRLGSDDAAIAAQSSLDLSTWLETPVFIGSFSNGDGTETLRFRSIRPVATEDRVFLRAQATLLP